MRKGSEEHSSCQGVELARASCRQGAAIAGRGTVGARQGCPRSEIEGLGRRGRGGTFPTRSSRPSETHQRRRNNKS